MPIITINDFKQGLSSNDKSNIFGSFAVGLDIDLERDLGYLKPAYAATTVTKSNDATQIIDDLITDIILHPEANEAFLIGDEKIYHMSAAASDKFDSNFDGASHYYYSVSGAADLESLAIYPISATNHLFYAYNHGSKPDIGKHDLSSAFDDDFMSVSAAGAATLQNAPHPMIEFRTYLWIGNGKYVSKFDGQTGANGTFTEQALDLPQGWEITALFPTKNYLGICAWKKTSGSLASLRRTQSVIWLWDMTSSDANQIIELPGIGKITAALNHNGTIYLWYYGTKMSESYIGVLTQYGITALRNIKHDLSGTVTNMACPIMNGVDIHKNYIVWGPGIMGSYALLWSYGKEDLEQPDAFTIINTPSVTANSKIGAVKEFYNGNTYYGYFDGGSVYHLAKIGTGNSTSAQYKANWIEPAIPDDKRKIRIKSVKFWFKVLVSGDVVTPTIEIDNGTSKGLTDPKGNTTISYANDGAITFKEFSNMKIDCYNFRPVLNWDGGGTAFSKIEINYDFI